MFSHLFLDIDAGTINWSRAQFALTAIYHWLFVPLTLGLAVIMGIIETRYYRTRLALNKGQADVAADVDFWRNAAKFWQKLFGINFAMGVATGIILEFEFGTNWSNYSWFVGDIFGAPLAIEGIVAFFMESTFVAVMYFGWKKVSPGFHLASTWLTGLGATISAWIIGAVFCVGVCSWYLMKRRETRLATESLKIGAWVGLIASLGAAFTGHISGQQVAKVQPMKLAAMEALYNGGTEQGLTAIGWVNPFQQPDFTTEESPALKIDIPYALSIMATDDPHGYVPGINDILDGYTRPDGTIEPSVYEKMQMGQQAITSLAAYRQAKKNGDAQKAATELAVLKDNIQYLGYGYIKDPTDVVPNIPINFWAFRVMVGLGMVFILFFALMLILSYRIPYVSIIVRRLLSSFGLLPETHADTTGVTGLPDWHYWLAIALIPLAYVASESGWLVAEFGRQPWTIQDMLPTWAAVSDLHSSSVMITFFLFLILFTTMLAVEISILLKQIAKGPEYEH